MTHNRESYEFITAASDMSFNKLSRILYDRLGWNIFEREAELTWRMLQIGISQARYVGVNLK